MGHSVFSGFHVEFHYIACLPARSHFVLSFSYLVAFLQGRCLNVSVQTRKACKSLARVWAGAMISLPPAFLLLNVDSAGVKGVPVFGKGYAFVPVY